jgi:hypothetical protein
MDMMNLLKSKEDKEIEKILAWMEQFPVNSIGYNDGLALIERLTAIKEKRSWKIKPEIWVPAATSVVSILIVLNYEKVNVITSKAFNMIRK